MKKKSTQNKRLKIPKEENRLVVEKKERKKEEHCRNYL
jgi:hypothetical protein